MEANYYGAASSNHAEAMAPYFPTLDALVPLGRQRASLKSWAHGGHGAGGTAGQMVESMGCACDNCESAATVGLSSDCCCSDGGPLLRTDDQCYEEKSGKRCPESFGGFDGIEIPSAMGAFVEMHFGCDSAMRSTAAMAAQPYIDFADYTGNQTFIRQSAFPFVREVGECSNGRLGL